MIDHTDVVVRVKAQLEARGVSLAGPDGAFAITKRVAWALRAEGAGLLDKPGGNNAGGYATDIIVYPTGQHFDILTDGGNTNGAQWADAGLVDASRYRPAIDPRDEQTAPVEPPPAPRDEVLLARLTSIEDLVQIVALNVQALRQEVAKPVTFPNYSGTFFGKRITLRPEPA